MGSLDEKIRNNKEINVGEMSIGDWELDTSDPLSPFYNDEPTFKEIVLSIALYAPIYYLGRLKDFSIGKTRSALQRVTQYFHSFTK